MTRGSQQHGERFEARISVAAPPAVVFGCFFKPEALRAWWQVIRSVTTPVPLGVYAVEWATTPFRDELLGALGGVLHGTVVDVRPGQRFFIADVSSNSSHVAPSTGEPSGVTTMPPMPASWRAPGFEANAVDLIGAGSGGFVATAAGEPPVTGDDPGPGLTTGGCPSVGRGAVFPPESSNMK